MRMRKTFLFLLLFALIFSQYLFIFIRFNHSNNVGGTTQNFTDYNSIKASSPIEIKHLWNKTWGGTGNQFIYSLALDSTENIYAALNSNFEKFDSNGNTLLLGEGYSGIPTEILVDPYGYIYVAGYSSGNMWLAKYENNGSTLWDVTWDSGEDDYCYSMGLDSDNDVYLFGAVLDNYDNPYYALIKYNNNGIQQWNKTWRPAGMYLYQHEQAMHIDSNDNIYVIGFVEDYPEYYLHLTKLNVSGDQEWEVFYTLLHHSNLFYDLTCDFSGNVYLAASSDQSGQTDLFLSKYNDEGGLLWDTIYSSSPLIHCNKIAIDRFGEIYCAGITNVVGAGQYDFCLVKFNQSGSPEGYVTWGSVEDEWLYDIAIDSTNGIYLCGTSNGFGINEEYNYCLVKLKSISKLVIENPVSNQIFGFDSPNYDLTYSETNLNKSWYTVNNGNKHFFEGKTGKIDQDTWNSCENGTINLKFFVNNTIGVVESEVVVVRKDIIIPKIDIIYPLSYQIYSNKTPNFELSIDEPNLDQCWYTLDGGINNYTFSGDWFSLNQSAWDECSNGTVNITFFGKDIVGNLGSESINIYKDIYAPYIEIINPELFTLHGKVLNYEIIKYGTNINSTWYTINNGLKYEFNTTVGDINLNAWSNADDGILSLKFFINDSNSREVFNDVRIVKDATDPTIIINSPTPNFFLSNSSPNYDVNFSDINLNSTWYTMDGGLTNVTLTENPGKIEQANWDLLEDGNITIRFCANDTVNNVAFKETVVHKDTTNPEISINSPIINELYLNSTPNFNISIIESNLNKSWYTINNGLKYFITNFNGIINQSAWDLCSDGYVNVTFYANDFSGNIGFNSVKIRKNLESREAYAIVIGISDYPGSSDDLNYCDDDAIAVYNMLLNDYNFRSENIIYLQDSSASKADIDNAFATIASLISPGDIFFFYYSGHGGHGTYSTQGTWNVETSHPYLNNYDQIWSVSHPGAIAMRVHFERFQLENYYDYVLCGSWGVTQGYYYEELTGDLGLNFWSSYIPVSRYYIRFVSDSSNPYPYYGFKIDKYEAILEDGTHFLCSYDSIPSNPSAYYMDTLLDSKLDLINCADKYVVLDSCNSGGLIPEVQDIGRYIMTACRGIQESTESSILEHGVFTNYLLESNENANDQNGDGVISMEECYDYAYSHTVSYSGSYGDQYHPQESDGIVGESVLYPSLAAVNYEFSDNTLNYSFFLYGHGMLKTVNITVCSVEPVITLNTFNLRSQVTSTTGFGFYEGILEIDQGNFASGFKIYIEVEGNKVIIFNQTFGDSDGDGLTDFFEIMEGSGLNPSSNDTDNDGLSDYDEFYGPTNPLNPDSDSDGLLDGEEVNIYNTDPLDVDSDSDGLLDGEEVNTYNTDPLQEDSDSDSLSDGDEINIYFTNPLNNDTDSDSLSDGNEVNIYTTNPLSNDTDSDDLSDSEEIFTYDTNPLSDDTDSDGLLDGEEVNTYGTNPLDADSDSDGLSDYDELITYNTDPLNYDSDSDTMPDGWEVDNSLDPFTNDTALDPDNDQLTNIEEFQHGTLAMNNDTDFDGLLDGEEVFSFNTDPTIGDTDSDGLLDGEEVNLYNTNPLYDDTDSDGLLDGAEVNAHNTDPLSGDTDSDTMPDKWEVDYLLNPLVNDTMLDPDNDDLLNILEYQHDTNPQNPDTDYDGWTDGDEILVYDTDPLDPDDHPTPSTPTPAAIPGYNIIIVISIVGWMSLVLIRKKKFNVIKKTKI